MGGFFAGRLNDIPVLSLKATGGGDINAHATPDSDTIFHSSMPHVIVTERYEMGLSAVGYDYFTATLPSQVASYISNTDRIVITMLTLRDSNGVEWNMQIQGGSTSQGYTYYGGLVLDIKSGAQQKSTSDSASDTRATFQFGNGLAMDAGYFYNGSGGEWRHKIAQGTGGMYDFSYFGSYRATTQGSSNGNPVVPPTDFNPVFYAGWGGYDGDMYVASNTGSGGTYPDSAHFAKLGSYKWSFNLGNFNSPTGRSKGYDAFYVRLGPPRMGMGSALYGDVAIGYENKLSYVQADIRSIFEPGQSNTGEQYRVIGNRVSIHTPTEMSTFHEGVPVSSIDYNTSYPMTPIKVTWLITNLNYDGDGNYSASNPFTGSEVLLKRDQFTVKGVNLGATPWSFLQMVTNGAQNANGKDYMGSNIYTPNGSLNHYRGLLPYPLARGDTGDLMTWGGENSAHFAPASLGLFRFNANNGWYVESAGPSIGNGTGPIWSPNLVPLKLFTSNRASVVIGNNLVINNDAVSEMARVDLGLNSSRNGAVICTLEFFDGSLFRVGGFGGANGNNSNPLYGPTGGNDSLISGIRTSGGLPSMKFHDVLTLPTGSHVPVYTWRTTGINWKGGNALNQSVWRYPDGGWAIDTNIQMALVLSLFNRGDGTLSIFLHRANSTESNRFGIGKLAIPLIRVSVQKLA